MSDVRITAIKVGKRYRKDLGNLDGLVKSIERVGLLQPIVITKANKRLIAGYRRLEACKLLGWEEIPAHSIELKEIIRGEYAENTERKPFLPTEIDAIRRDVEPIEARLAKKRMGGKKSSTSGTTRDKVAAATGVSGRTLSKIKEVVDAAKDDPEQYGHLTKQMDETGNVDRAHRSVRRKKTVAAQDKAAVDPGPLDKGKKYTVIYADVPWPEEAWSKETGLDRSPEKHYRTMTLDEIKALPVPSIAHDDCAMFFWTKANRMADAIDIIRLWGFTYKTQFIWIKDSIGLGRWLRDKHEILCVCTKGNRPPPEDKLLVPSTFYADKNEHSVKPLRAYEIIESYYPGAPCIELFARDTREGWDSWGEESPEDTPATPASAQNCDGEANQATDEDEAQKAGDDPVGENRLTQSAEVAEPGGDSSPSDDLEIPESLRRKK